METPSPFTPPAHSDPTLTAAGLWFNDIRIVVGRMHLLYAGDAMGAVEVYPTEVLINGRLCGLTGDVMDRWYLTETIDHGGNPRPKVFYLLPNSEEALTAHGGSVPHLVCPDIAFDHRYGKAPASRRVRRYIMDQLLDRIRD